MPLPRFIPKVVFQARWGCGCFAHGSSEETEVSRDLGGDSEASGTRGGDVLREPGQAW